MEHCAIPLAAMSDASRRGVVTDENRRESAALKKLWEARQAATAARGEPFTQETFGKRYGYSQSTVTHCLNGRMAISKELARDFVEFLGLSSVAAFSDRLQREIDGLAPNVIGLGGRSLTLANEFERLPEKFEDGGTKEAFLRELLALIWHRPHRAGKPAPGAAPSQSPQTAPKKRPGKARAR